MDRSIRMRFGFEDIRDGILEDLSGFENHGVLKGTRWVPGVNGSGIFFSGQGDRIDCGCGESLQCDAAFTFSAWISTGPFESGCIVSKGSDFGTNGSFFLRHSDGYLGFVALGDGGYQMRWSEQVKLDDWQWHHIACVYDGDRGLMDLYVDGLPVNGSRTGTGVPRSLNRSGASMVIGSGIDGDFRGMMDEVRMYGRALSCDEIANLAGEFEPAAVDAVAVECRYASK